MPPAARCTSDHTSVNAPTEPAPSIAYSRNWPSVPGVSSPETTFLAPIHSTAVIEPNTSTTTIAVSVACRRMRLRAMPRATSTAAPKRLRS